MDRHKSKLTVGNDDVAMDETGLGQWFTTNDNGQFEFAFPAENDTVNNLANVIQDAPYAGPSEPFNGIHRHPSGSGDAVAGPSKIPHRSS